jgi:hypothetical protein
MIKTTEATKIAADTAKAQVAPIVNVAGWMKLYHWDGSKKIAADLTVRNDGKTAAQDVFTATKLEFRGALPAQSEYDKFTNTDFKSLSPILRPYVSSKDNAEFFPEDKYTTPVGQDSRLYVWGKIAYKDFWGERATDKFCWYVSAKQVLESHPGNETEAKQAGYTGTVGYQGFTDQCDTPVGPSPP